MTASLKQACTSLHAAVENACNNYEAAASGAHRAWEGTIRTALEVLRDTTALQDLHKKAEESIRQQYSSMTGTSLSPIDD